MHACVLEAVRVLTAAIEQQTAAIERQTSTMALWKVHLLPACIHRRVPIIYYDGRARTPNSGYLSAGLHMTHPAAAQQQYMP
eukprot:1163126-Amphidinium_carterae.1